MPQQISAPDAGLAIASHQLPPNRIASTSSIAQADPVSAPQMPGMESGNQPCKLHITPAILIRACTKVLSLELQ